MKHICLQFFILSFCAVPIMLMAQESRDCPLCPKYETFMKQGKALLVDGKVEAALPEFQAAQVAARACNCNTKEPARFIDAVFIEIQKQRDNAVAEKLRAIKAENKARIEKENAKRALEKNKVILSYFPFYKDKVAWAYSRTTGKFGLIDTAGTPITEFVYDIAAVFDDDICITSRNGKKLLLGIDGKKLSEGDGYDAILPVMPGRYKADAGFLVKLFNSSSYIYFDSIGAKINGMSKVRRGDEWNLMDDANKLMLPGGLTAIGDYSENLLRVKDAIGWYYIDAGFQRATDKYFTIASDFHNGQALVIYKGRIQNINQGFDLGQLNRSVSAMKLGAVDGYPANPDIVKDYFLSVNGEFVQNLMENKFRDEDTWREQVEVPNFQVSSLQQMLNFLGFMPYIRIKGIFDYYTQSSVRLLQENVRSVLGDQSIGIPDGIVGPSTFAHIVNADFTVWDSLAKKDTHEFEDWLALLEGIKKFYLKHPTPILQKLNDVNATTGDTRKVADWRFSPADVHLIGIRRKEDERVERQRANDDVFILLINNMVFKFWGSTDPSPRMASRSDLAFLSEGQHLYRVDWHKISDTNNIYRALRPKLEGVLVLRDRNGDGALDSDDIGRGFDDSPNLSINIHWSGIGNINYSAGSQVIAGGSYINQYDQAVSCGAFAAFNPSALGAGKTKAAYNVLMDLILTYSKQGLNSTVYYTLLKEDVFEKVRPELGPGFVEGLLNRMKTERNRE